MKERYAQSQMRKQANRMTFGEVIVINHFNLFFCLLSLHACRTHALKLLLFVRLNKMPTKLIWVSRLDS